MSEYDVLATLALGDLVSIQAARWESIRSVAVINDTTLGVGTFAVCGELDFLLLSCTNNSILTVYTPVNPVPSQVVTGVCVKEGRSRYWAPNSPAISGGMGELHWRVVKVSNQGAPAVLIWRGGELTVFWAQWQTETGKVLFDRLNKPTDEILVKRYAAQLPTPGLELGSATSFG